MGFTNKAQYLTALFRMLPFGLLALYYGIQGLAVKTKVDSLYKVSGEIVYAGIKSIHSKGTSSYMDAFIFLIRDNFDDTIQCYTFVTKYREKLKVLEGIKGDYITVWCDPELDNQIEQVEHKNQLVIRFSGRWFVYLFFVLLGGLYTVVTLLYLIKYPEHLFNKNKGKK